VKQDNDRIRVVRAAAGQARSVASEICIGCGLCCDGSIFADVKLQTGDRPDMLKSYGLQISSAKRFCQPCAAFNGQRCEIYSGRPTYCRQFECLLYKRVKSGETSTAAALRIIKKTKAAAHKVRSILSNLGDADEHVSIGKRFRQTTQRIQHYRPDNETAARYGELTVAMHELNLVIREHFYASQDKA